MSTSLMKDWKGHFSNSLQTRKKFLWMLLVTILTIAIALGVGLGVGLDHCSDEDISKIVAVEGGTTYQGSCDDYICSWLGIPYAAAPVGSLRFAPPIPASPGKYYSALKLPPICPQQGNIKNQDEDCLFLNIQKPKSSATLAQDKPLPVLVFFHGGGFESGSSNDNDPREIINLSSQYNQSILVVRINYRLGLLGFLASDEMESHKSADNIALNRGFKDMKMAVEWVQTYIGSFGGDRSRITIWGQSAGSFGASALVLGYPTNAPFQAAILESGAPGGVPIDRPIVKNAQYQRVLTAANCASSTDTTSCLRSIPWQTLRNISLSETIRAMQPATYARGLYAWTGVIDGGPSQGGFFASRPSEVISSGKFAHVPILHGDCLDEGTYFAPKTLNSNSDFSQWLSSIYFKSPDLDSSATTTLINQVLQAYPDDPSIGSPYVPSASLTDRFFGSTNQFKRAASVYGDLRYQSNRRLWLNTLANNNVKAYSYLYAQGPSSSSPSLGVPHGSDLGALLQSSPNPISKTYARYYIAFANNQDPGSAGTDLPAWPLYTAFNPVMLQFQSDKITQIKDTYRAAGITLLNSAQALLATGR